MVVVVTEHADWPERRSARTLLLSDEVDVVQLDNGEIHAVPARNVFTPGGLAYAEEWAVKADRSIYDVYVPAALRVIA